MRICTSSQGSAADPLAEKRGRKDMDWLLGFLSAKVKKR
jgi:hypothetical protein